MSRTKQRRMRDLLLLVYGVGLGIIGNILVEYVIALVHPKGISQTEGLTGVIIYGFILVAYLIAFVLQYFNGE